MMPRLSLRDLLCCSVKDDDGEVSVRRQNDTSQGTPQIANSTINQQLPTDPPAGGEKKRKAALSREAGGSKKGKTLPPDYSTDTDDGGEEWQPRAKPLAKS